jgi:glutathione S-transferase
MGLEPDEAAISASMPKARPVFAELARLLGKQSFLLAKRSRWPTSWSPVISFFTERAELGAPHSYLAAWLARMEARSSMKATTWQRVAELAKAA